MNAVIIYNPYPYVGRATHAVLADVFFADKQGPYSRKLLVFQPAPPTQLGRLHHVHPVPPPPPGSDSIATAIHQSLLRSTKDTEDVFSGAVSKPGYPSAAPSDADHGDEA